MSIAVSRSRSSQFCSERTSVLHPVLARAPRGELHAGRALGAQPAAADRRVRVALDLDHLAVLDVDVLPAAHRAIGAYRLDHGVRRARPRLAAAVALGRGAEPAAVGPGELPVHRPRPDAPSACHVRRHLRFGRPTWEVSPTPRFVRIPGEDAFSRARARTSWSEQKPARLACRHSRPRRRPSALVTAARRRPVSVIARLTSATLVPAGTVRPASRPSGAAAASTAWHPVMSSRSTTASRYPAGLTISAAWT